MSENDRTIEGRDAILQQTREHVRAAMSGEGSGHDWWHVYRVWRMALHLCRTEETDTFVVELTALLHDLADWKFRDGDGTVGPRVARAWLEEQKVAEATIEHVCEIIGTMSFKGGNGPSMRTREGMVVQDADRLDAIGAIGIARNFAYGGHKGRLLHDPELEPVAHLSVEEYLAANGSTVNHFYEKSLLLKDRLNTRAARGIAEERHRFMEEYLDRFFREWEGEA